MADKFHIGLPNELTAPVEKLALFAGVLTVQIINAKRLAPKNNPYDGSVELAASNTQPKDEPIGIGSLGTPIYTDLTILGCSYIDNITGRKVNLENDMYRSGGATQSTAGNQIGIGAAFYMNFESVLITVDQPIKVIKTEIQGRDGTVKEYIGQGDADIVINGYITGKNGVYPREQVKKFQRWLDAPVAKEITAWWLENLGISHIVIESYSFPQVQGGYSYQMFTVKAVSDTPVELKITQPAQ